MERKDEDDLNPAWSGGQRSFYSLNTHLGQPQPPPRNVHRLHGPYILCLPRRLS